MSKASGTQLAKANGPGRADLPALLESSRDRIAAVLPAGVSPERFAKVALVAYAANPDLAKCSPRSVLTCVMQAAELGLDVGKPLDLAHLVPFGGECQLLIDYKGFLALARRSGEFALIDARLVHSHDTFVYEFAPELVYHHRPCLDIDRGPITHAYGVAKLANGEWALEVMRIEEIDAIRRLSRSANSPAWKNHYGEMARKVVLKRLLKRQARTVDVARAAEIDDSEYANPVPPVTVRPAGMSRSEEIGRRLAEARPPVAEAATDVEEEDEPPAIDGREPGED